MVGGEVPTFEWELTKTSLCDTTGIPGTGGITPGTRVVEGPDLPVCITVQSKVIPGGD